MQTSQCCHQVRHLSSIIVCVHIFVNLISVAMVLSQLWNEAEFGLSSGDVVGVLGAYLHLYKEKRRYSG